MTSRLVSGGHQTEEVAIHGILVQVAVCVEVREGQVVLAGVFVHACRGREGVGRRLSGTGGRRGVRYQYSGGPRRRADALGAATS